MGSLWVSVCGSVAQQRHMARVQLRSAQSLQSVPHIAGNQQSGDVRGGTNWNSGPQSQRAPKFRACCSKFIATQEARRTCTGRVTITLREPSWATSITPRTSRAREDLRIGRNIKVLRIALLIVLQAFLLQGALPAQLPTLVDLTVRPPGPWQRPAVSESGTFGGSCFE